MSELVLSGRPKESSIPLLIKNGVSHVLCILQHSEVGSLLSTYRFHKLPYTHHAYSIKKADKLQIDWQVIKRDLDYLAKLDGKLLIHCAAGIHRTGTSAYAILIRQGLSKEEAYKTVLRLRPESADCIRFLDWAEEHLL